MIAAQSEIPSYCWGELNDKLYYILKNQPGTLFALSRLAEMLGKNEFQIEMALEEIEGPAPSEVPGAFVHLWRSTGEAIYLP
ncbi:MAG: hypothetical protein ACYDGS_10315 [Thermoleophilia bacterium]